MRKSPDTVGRFFVFSLYIINIRAQRKNYRKITDFPKKKLDLEIRLCYIVTYLSDERFIFARIFAWKNKFPLSYREADIRTDKRG